jgi:hypothetical protein
MVLSPEDRWRSLCREMEDLGTTGYSATGRSALELLREARSG